MLRARAQKCAGFALAPATSAPLQPVQRRVNFEGAGVFLFVVGAGEVRRASNHKTLPTSSSNLGDGWNSANFDPIIRPVHFVGAVVVVVGDGEE